MLSSASPTTVAIAGCACAIGIVLLRQLRSRELHHLRTEFEQAVQSGDQLAEQLKAERAAAAEAHVAEVAELKAQLESLTAKLESLDSGVEIPASADRRKAPASLQVAGETRTTPRGQLTPLSTERKWNTALLRSSLFATEVASEDADGWAAIGKPKKLAL